jgi:hypothetical protein
VSAWGFFCRFLFDYVPVYDLGIASVALRLAFRRGPQAGRETPQLPQAHGSMVCCLSTNCCSARGDSSSACSLCIPALKTFWLTTMSNCCSGQKQKKKCKSAEKRAREYRFYFFNFSGRLIEDAEKCAECNASSRKRISRAFYFLDKAMNKIQQRRPKFQAKNLQRIVDKGTMSSSRRR